jgi:hypothetical protein
MARSAAETLYRRAGDNAQCTRDALRGRGAAARVPEPWVLERLLSGDAVLRVHSQLRSQVSWRRAAAADTTHQAAEKIEADVAQPRVPCTAE